MAALAASSTAAFAAAKPLARLSVPFSASCNDGSSSNTSAVSLAASSAKTFSAALALSSVLLSSAATSPPPAAADIAGLTPCKESKVFANSGGASKAFKGGSSSSSSSPPLLLPPLLSSDLLFLLPLLQKWRGGSTLLRAAGGSPAARWIRPCSPSARRTQEVRARLRAGARHQRHHREDQAPVRQLRQVRPPLRCRRPAAPHRQRRPAALGRVHHPRPALPLHRRLDRQGRQERYLIAIRGEKKPAMREIIIDVELATRLLPRGFIWPVAAYRELINGDLVVDDADIGYY